MNWCLVSAFRNASDYIERYCTQMDALQDSLHKRGDTLTLVLGYGDSKDKTAVNLFEELDSNLFRYDNVVALDVTHGGHFYGSIVNKERFKDLAFVFNKLWDNIPESADYVGIIESDLLWQPDSIVGLVEGLEDDVVAAIAPKVLHATNPGLYEGDGPFWYDTLAFVKDGKRFKNKPPYHLGLLEQDGLVEVDSAGSVLLMKSETARQVGFTEEEVVMGMCQQIREQFGKIWLDTRLTVYHP